MNNLDLNINIIDGPGYVNITNGYTNISLYSNNFYGDEYNPLLIMNFYIENFSFQEILNNINCGDLSFYFIYKLVNIVIFCKKENYDIHVFKNIVNSIFHDVQYKYQSFKTSTEAFLLLVNKIEDKRNLLIYLLDLFNFDNIYYPIEILSEIDLMIIIFDKLDRSKDNKKIVEIIYSLI
jgi:hypothetical protein